MAELKLDHIPVIIPTLNPDHRLLEITSQLHDAGFAEIIIIDDGSDASCGEIFTALEQRGYCHILHHGVNRGKGAALKTAFMDYLSRHPGGRGGITTDDDGQHTLNDIINVAENFAREPDSLHLGCRNFDQDNVPWKSKFGNTLTRGIFRLLAGVSIADTQTGLRAIPAEVMELSLAIPGNRFEFETEMLLRAWDKNIKFNEITIETVYLDNNAGTHFHPIKDAALIYRVIFLHLMQQLFRFLLSSMSSALIDVLVFMFLIKCFAKSIFDESSPLALPLLASCAVARIISAAWNYPVNRYWVFAVPPEKRTPWGTTLLKYLALGTAIFSVSYWTTFELAQHSSRTLLPYWKLLIDTGLFFFSFIIQKSFIFKRKS